MIYIIVLGLCGILSIWSAVRLKGSYTWIGMYVILAFMIQFITLKNTGINNYLFWMYSIASTAVLLMFIYRKTTNAFRQKIVGTAILFSFAYGIAYYFLFGLHKAVPNKLIIVTDPIILMACAIYFLDIIRRDELKNLSTDIPFIILSLAFVYHALRLPYLTLMNEYGKEFSQNGSIVHDFFNWGNGLYYVGLTVTLVVFALKPSHES